MENKKIKDPIYGYISIPIEYMKSIIDTSMFQRLRRVIQTSYSPLYASALHNRFAHSLGVFYLGNIVANQLRNVIIHDNILSKDLSNKYARIYKIACLLHDVGHAPFSHTGEIFYKNDKFEVKDLHERLCLLVNSNIFQDDVAKRGETNSAAPHEIMSAIIGIKEFGSIIGDDESKELFARCITGYVYNNHSVENDIKNCFINMLNSKVIDVDRLDYLIRDAYISGFATINIDYMRLINALTITKNNNQYQIAFYKDAVSLIENVVYAHDAERKWIQNHPIVLYEAYLLKSILEHLNKNLNSDSHKLFSEESLSKKGHTLNGHKISLMCDDDIIYLAKNVFPSTFSDEFFERNKRRHPIWKSEAEYSAYIGGLSNKGNLKDSFVTCMNSFKVSRVSDYQIPMIINDNLVKQFKDELKKVERNTDQFKDIKKRLKVCDYLKRYSKKHDFQFDFIIISTSMFISNFSKEHLGKTLITFEKDTTPKELKEVCNLLKSSPESEDESKDLYYLFYRRNEENKKGKGKINDVSTFCRELFFATNYQR